PPALNTRSQISVISRRGATSTDMRLSSPRRSSWVMKSLKSRYFTGASARGRGAGEQWNAPHEFRDDTHPYRGADPVIQRKSTEAIFAAAPANQQILICDDACRHDETRKITQ